MRTVVCQRIRSLELLNLKTSQGQSDELFPAKPIAGGRENGDSWRFVAGEIRVFATVKAAGCPVGGPKAHGKIPIVV